MRRKSIPIRALPSIAVLTLVLGCQSGNAATEEPQPGKAQSQPTTTLTAKPQSPKVIGQGAEIDLATQRDPERTTVFDFTSAYCPPCQRIAPYLDKLHEGRDDVAVVKVDINRPDTRGIDWASPTARQFGLQQIPHFKVMDKEGTIIAEGNMAWDLVVKWIMAMDQPGGR
jgi:thioredoxin